MGLFDEELGRKPAAAVAVPVKPPATRRGLFDDELGRGPIMADVVTGAGPTVPEQGMGAKLASMLLHPLDTLNDVGGSVARGIVGARAGDALGRSGANLIAGPGHAITDFASQTLQNPLVAILDAMGVTDQADARRDPLALQAAADQTLAVSQEINADRQATQLARPTLTDLIANPGEAIQRYSQRTTEGVVESALPLALAAATRNPEIGSSLMGALTGTQEYTDLRGQGVGRRDAATAGALSAAAERAGEMTSLPRVMGKEDGNILTAALAEGMQEAPVSIAQTNISDQATGQQTPIIEQLLGAMDAAFTGAAAGGGVRGAAGLPGMLRGSPADAPVDAPPPTDITPTPEALADLLRAAPPPTPSPAPTVAPRQDAPVPAAGPVAPVSEPAPVAAPVATPEPAPAAVAPPAGPVPDKVEVTATTKKGEYKLVDTLAPPGSDFSEFGTVRMVEAFDGDTKIGELLYANDGTPPTINVEPEHQRKGVGTAMLKLAKQNGGNLGDRRTGMTGMPNYRTEQGAKFRERANEDGVTLTPLQATAPVTTAPPVATITEPDGSAFDQLPANEPAAVSPLDVRDEIGWDQVGGQVLRSEAGDVNGRTTWTPKAAPGGVASMLWSNRPNRHLTQAQAHAAMDKFERGEPLKPIEQRFIDHATSVAAGYAEAERAMSEELADYDAKALADEVRASRDEIHALAESAELSPRNDTESYDEWAERLIAATESNDGPVTRPEEESPGEPVEAQVPARAQGGGVAEAAAGVAANDDASVTSLANDVKDAEREARGAEPLRSGESLSNQDNLDRGRQAIEEDANRVAETTERILTGESIKPGDQAVLAAESVRLNNELRAAKAAGDTAKWDSLQVALDANERASRAIGSELGRELQFRQAGITQDYTIEAMQRERRDAIGPLSIEQDNAVAEWAAKFEQAQQRAVAAETALADMRALKATRAEKGKRPTLEALKERADKARAALAAMEGVKSKRQQSGAVMNPVALVYLTEIGAYHVANGAYKFADWVAGMKADLGDQFAEFKQSMRDVFREAKARAKGKTADEVYQASRSKQLDRAQADIKARIADGDFESAQRRAERVLNKENEAKQFELHKLKQQWAEENFRLAMERRPRGQKIMGAAGDFLDLSRAIMASSDLPPVLRQGGHLFFSGHWKMLASALRASLRAMVSEKAEHAELQKIWDSPAGKRHGKSWVVGKKRVKLGVSESSTGYQLSHLEEAFAARWLANLPNSWKTSLVGAGIGMAVGGPVGAGIGAVAGLRGGSIIRASARSYTVFLSHARAAYADWMFNTFTDSETPSDLQGYAITNFVNVMTGKGGLGDAEAAAKTLARVFFAPRFWASQVQTLALQPMWPSNTDGRVRKLIAKQYAREIAGYVGLFTMVAIWAGMRDDEEKKKDPRPIVSFNPLSTLFGQIRVGNTYINPLRGLSSPITLASRIAAGETVSAAGKRYATRDSLRWNDLKRFINEKAPDLFGAPLEIDEYANRVSKKKKAEGEQLGYKDDTTFDQFVRYVRGKLAPGPAAMATVASNMEDMVGEKKTPGELLAGMYTPMSPRDIFDVAHEQYGVATKAIITAFTMFGAGAQVHQPKEEKDADAAQKKEAATGRDADPRMSAMPEGRRAEYVGYNANSTLTPAPDVLKGAKNAPAMVMVGDYSGLPKDIADGFDNGAAGVFDPSNQTVYVTMGMDEAESKFVAYHEIAGHYGLQGSLGASYKPVLTRAHQNPVVAKLAKAIGADPLYAKNGTVDNTEEALAELAAAQRTNDYPMLEQRWGITIPAAAKPGVEGALRRVVQQTKRTLGKLTGSEPEAYDDEQVYDLIADAWKYVERAPATDD